MEEKAKTQKYCVNCTYFEPFYTKAACSFYREPRGFCSKERKMSENREVCCGWERKRANKKNLHRRTCLLSLRKMMSDLSEIRQILKEDGEEE